MSDLTEFLLARIAEDEQAARATEHPDGPDTLHWRRGGKRVLHFDNGAREDYEAVFAGDWARILVARDSANGGPLTAHIARHDPARVLAECEAKRRIVEGLLDAERAVATYDHDHPTDAYWQEWGNRHALALAVELLALPYADHEDYRPEWRP